MPRIRCQLPSHPIHLKATLFNINYCNILTSTNLRNLLAQAVQPQAAALGSSFGVTSDLLVRFGASCWARF